MKEQYVENTFLRYFIFGDYPETDKVDIHDRNKLIAHKVDRRHAELIVEDRNAAVNMIIELANRLDEISPDDFNEVWYGIKKTEQDKNDEMNKLLLKEIGLLIDLKTAISQSLRLSGFGRKDQKRMLNHFGDSHEA